MEMNKLQLGEIAYVLGSREYPYFYTGTFIKTILTGGGVKFQMLHKNDRWSANCTIKVKRLLFRE
jgi:hypothetical protein